MQKIGLVLDEAADLPKEMIEKEQIETVSFKIDFQQLKDLTGNIYQRMREGEKRGIPTFIKTSQPSPKDFLNAFKKQLQRFENVICITITSKLSGTYNSAVQAKSFLEEKLKNKTLIIDSLTGSAGEGLLAIKALKLAQKGEGFEEIVKKIRETVPKIHLVAMVEDPKWLEACGRLSHLAAVWVRKMQQIGVRPLICVRKGKLWPAGIKTGVKDISTALFKEIELKTLEMRKKGRKINVAITHTDNLEGAEKLKQMIEKKLKDIKITFVNFTNSAIGGLAGPGALIISWEE